MTVTAGRGHLKQAGVTARPRYVAISVHEVRGGVAVGVTRHGYVLVLELHEMR